MAYTALATAVTGDLWTAANHNTYIKDNFAAGVPDIFTAAGDVAYSTGANAAAALAIGTAGQAFVVNSGATAPEWGSPLFGCNLSVTTDLSLTAGTTNAIAFDTENYDTSAFWAIGAPTTVTIPWDGIYMCNGVVDFGVGSPTAASGIFKVGDTVVGYEYGATTSKVVSNFSYVNRFAASANAGLTIFAGTNVTILSIDYSVTYLGAST